MSKEQIAILTLVVLTLGSFFGFVYFAPLMELQGEVRPLDGQIERQ